MGTEKVMQAAQSTFISSTNWTDSVGPAAALATIKKYELENVHNHIINLGKKVKKIWEKASLQNNIEIETSGLPTLASFTFKSEHQTRMNTYFVIEMLKNNILGFRQFKPSYAL